MRITVTQDDIDMGCKSHNENCPLARAASRAFGYPVRVDGFEIYSVDKGGFTHNLATLPRRASEFVRDFDLGRTMQPFTFTVTLLAREDAAK
jgi:hypothetical protein